MGLREKIRKLEQLAPNPPKLKRAINYWKVK